MQALAACSPDGFPATAGFATAKGHVRSAAGRAAERRAAAGPAASAALPDAEMADAEATELAPEGPDYAKMDAAGAPLGDKVPADSVGEAAGTSAAAAAKSEAGDDAEELLAQDGASSSQCPVCLEPMAAKVPHIYPCGHVFCRECSEKVRDAMSLCTGTHCGCDFGLQSSTATCPEYAQVPDI